MQSRKWVSGDDNVDELYEYKNFGVLKNYVGSFSSNADDSRWWDSNSQPLDYKPSALAIEYWW